MVARWPRPGWEIGFVVPASVVDGLGAVLCAGASASGHHQSVGGSGDEAIAWGDGCGRFTQGGEEESAAGVGGVGLPVR